MKLVTLFSPGSYGNFISWVVYSFSTLNSRSTLVSPFEGSSAHAYRNSIGRQIVTASHTVLDDLYQNYILVEHSESKSINYIDNQFQKQFASNIEDYLKTIFPEVYIKLTNQWSEHHSLWELRELLSFYLHDMFIQTVQQNKKNIQSVSKYNCYTINPEQFISNIEFELMHLLDYFELSANNHIKDLDRYASEYIKRQDNFNKDDKISQFVEQAMLGNNYEFLNQTLFDQAWIQTQLRLHHYDIQCYNLNEFPLNSFNLTKLLIK